MLQTIMFIVNIVALCSIAVGYFFSKFTIVDLETWNEIATFYNENNKEVPELAGGEGFFREYLDEDEIDEEEE